MIVDVEPALFGVGALIVCGDEFAAVRETKTNPKSVKIEGQQTFPMETVEDYDADDHATLARACSEEVAVPSSQIKEIIHLNVIETRPGVELRNYAVELHAKEGVGPGTFIDEVSPVEWVSLGEVIENRGSLRFRPGVFETVVDYYRFRVHPETFAPGEYRHFQIVNQIPHEVYKWVLEEGISGKEALSRWNALR